MVKAMLWACVEDYAGLWELVWELNTQFPNYAASDREAAARHGVAALVETGLVKLYRCQEPYGELTELDAAGAEAAVASRKNWEAPANNAVSIRAGATDQGKTAYLADDYARVEAALQKGAVQSPDSAGTRAS